MWLDGVKEGSSMAAQRLWDRYFDQLVRLARGRLVGASRRVADEEDVALCALQSFLMGAAQGKFPQLDDRDDLWKVLVTITERKAWRQKAQEQRQRRGGGEVRGESVFQAATPSEPIRGLEQQPALEPTPEFAVQIAEEVARLLESLDNDVLRQVAMLKMQGHTVEEIAALAGCSTRSAKRKLALIREIWSIAEPADDRLS
ncbi:MAG: ECF-type sigma factor [Pirellulaceae bacterium]